MSEASNGGQKYPQFLSRGPQPAQAEIARERFGFGQCCLGGVRRGRSLGVWRSWTVCVCVCVCVCVVMLVCGSGGCACQLVGWLVLAWSRGKSRNIK